jgi:hypothetical protein
VIWDEEEENIFDGMENMIFFIPPRINKGGMQTDIGWSIVSR